MPKLWKGASVVMDNCTIHTGEEVKKAIQKKGAKLIYLSPYSPDFSPIENLWSKLKNILRSIRANASKFNINRIWYIGEELLSNYKTFNKGLPV